MITIDGTELDLFCFTGFRALVGDLCFFGGLRLQPV